MIRFLARSVRALASLAVILAVVAGAPWALVRFFGSPLPTSMPALDAVRDWFQNPATDTHLLAVVVLALWAGWAIFTYVMGAEVVAAVRGARAPRFRLAAPLHRVAAGLIGGRRHRCLQRRRSPRRRASRTRRPATRRRGTVRPHRRTRRSAAANR